jgi:hypothetical protein
MDRELNRQGINSFGGRFVHTRGDGMKGRGEGFFALTVFLVFRFACLSG